MKLNLTKLALTAGLSLGMISIASVAQARLSENSTSITGQTTEKQLPQQLKSLTTNGSSLTRQTTDDKQPTQSTMSPETSP